MNEAKRARFRNVLHRSRGFPERGLPELEWLLPYDDQERPGLLHHTGFGTYRLNTPPDATTSTTQPDP